LALISGVPAFNISYESKGQECYEYLGFKEFSVDYNAEHHVAESRLRKFLDSETAIRNQLPEILQKQNMRAQKDFDSFLSRLGLPLTRLDIQ
jgi:polysaccharide pyruvyl transferase WcaK-like protein